MGLWSRFTAWLSGWPESAEAKHGRSNHEEDLLFAEAEMKAKSHKPKPVKGLNPKKKKKAKATKAKKQGNIN